MQQSFILFLYFSSLSLSFFCFSLSLSLTLSLSLSFFCFLSDRAKRHDLKSRLPSLKKRRKKERRMNSKKCYFKSCFSVRSSLIHLIYTYSILFLKFPLFNSPQLFLSLVLCLYFSLSLFLCLFFLFLFLPLLLFPSLSPSILFLSVSLLICSLFSNFLFKIHDNLYFGKKSLMYFKWHT